MSTEHFVDARTRSPFSSIPRLLEHHAGHTPEAPAILAPGGAAMTYGLLYQQIEETGRRLRAMGIGRCDRVAVVLPNGPELAAAILAVEAWAICAPLNPAFGVEELQSCLAHLGASALITEAGADSPARRAARSRGVRILEISTAPGTAPGMFTLVGDPARPVADEPVRAGDLALLLFTSGTTARPKVVPLTHANICASASYHAAVLALGAADRCLNLLPLCHGHGLNATLLASLAAGASVVCTPGCDVVGFFSWLGALRTTWYSAVPAMHQAILAQAERHRDRVADCCLRFVRSSSAPLAPRVFAELERTFGVPVIEWYGMTEVASAPIACNPLPPRPRKPGSVGTPAGLDVAVMDEHGAVLTRGRTGEVVVRGETVTPGYDGDPAASGSAFVGDWLKTGDLGFIDDDGYLFLTGRIREIINRGGEKIMPREVDEVLLEHPAVAEAATFAVPHPRLGEDAAAAIVLHRPGMATPAEIRRFLIGRIADFKVPNQVLIVTELPKGPTGKVQRVGLAASLGLAQGGTMPQAYVAPRTPFETMLAEYWAEILRIESVGIYDNFFALGGDSLLVADLLAHVYDATQIEFDVSRFFEAPTVAELAGQIEWLRAAGPVARRGSAIVRAPRDGRAPASMVQERLAKLQRALPGIPLFNVLYPLRLASSFDVAMLERSINEIVQRHEILRTNFTFVEEQCVQVIEPQRSLRLGFDDLDQLPDAEAETARHRILQNEALHSFDLRQGPLLRARLLHLADQEWLLLITMHQIICDGWSLGVLVDEVIALYDAFSAREAPSLAPLAIQYADFAYWQRHWHAYPEMVAQLAYWRERLRDPPPVKRLATGRPQSVIDALQTARRELTLPKGLSESVKRFSLDHGGTLFMGLAAALKTLLYCQLGEDDIRIATLVANRHRPGTAGLIGPLVNMVILRTDLAGDPSAQELMRRVRTTTLAAFARQDLPFDVLAETLERERAVKPATLAQVMLQLQNATLRPTAGAGRALAVEEINPGMPMPLATMTTFDVILMLNESPDGLFGSCIYKLRLFETAAIDGLLGDFRSVLEQMVADPERPISAIRASLNENHPAVVKRSQRT